jgi:hypothetical protein
MLVVVKHVLLETASVADLLENMYVLRNSAPISSGNGFRHFTRLLVPKATHMGCLLHAPGAQPPNIHDSLGISAFCGHATITLALPSVPTPTKTDSNSKLAKK